MDVQSSFHYSSNGELRCQRKTRCNTYIFNVAQIRSASKFRCHNARYKFLTEHPRTQGREMSQFKLTSSHVTPLQEVCKLSAHVNKHKWQRSGEFIHSTSGNLCGLFIRDSVTNTTQHLTGFT